MLVGHLAVGLLGKRVAPAVSLGTLTLAALLADLSFCLLAIAGLEHVRIVEPGPTLTSSAVFDLPYSHSLLGGAIAGTLFASAYAIARGRTRGAWVLLAAVLSHWLLDVVSHRPDMPLVPNSPPLLGLGLWTSIPATMAAEGGLWLLALALYGRITRPSGRAAAYGFWIGVGLITLAWLGNIAGPPPADPSSIGRSSLLFFTFVVAWAYWMNRTTGGDDQHRDQPRVVRQP